MLFLNGFRVMPYGEPKDDWLQLNQRKTQGVRRFLEPVNCLVLLRLKIMNAFSDLSPVGKAWNAMKRSNS